MVTLTDLRDEIASAGAKEAFDVIVKGFSALAGLSLTPHEQGFLNSLRISRGEEFCFAVVPDDDWVLAYIRKPELRRGTLTPDAVQAEFPDARLTNKGEITLRIHDAATAVRWIEMIAATAAPAA